MRRFESEDWGGIESVTRLRAVPPALPRLFELKEPRRRVLLPVFWGLVVHAGLIYWLVGLELSRMPATSKPVPVVFRTPRPPPKPLDPPGGGAPARPVKARRIKLRVPPVIPPKLEEPPPEVKPPEEVEVAEADDDGDEDSGGGGTGLGTGTGSGTGVGSGTGPGQGGVPSKERKAWLVHTDWNCSRPGHEDLGRVVVRIRVEVFPSGKPGRVVVVKPNHEAFNQRAIACARDEMYIPALDRDGHPIPGEVEFGIDFRL